MITMSSECSTHAVIYAVLSRLNRFNSFSRYRAIVLEKSQKIDDLPVLATLPVWYFSDAFQPS